MPDPYYGRGDHYDAHHAHMTADIDFYRKVVAEFGGPVLELACGTGRIAGPIAKDGFDVVGLDREEPMLSEAWQKRHTNTQYICADMRDFDLARKFQTIILAFNALGHLHDWEQIEQCFACIKHHLKPGGVFVLAMFNPDLKLLSRNPDEEKEISRYADPDSDNEVVVFERGDYDRASQIMTAHWRYEIGAATFENTLRLRMFFPQELQMLLHYAGFNIVRLHGDFYGSPFVSGSPHQIFVATAARSS